MSVIHVLDEHMTNMIAAGEVVERPANIVKECVENAIDAGAQNIEIEVEEGGIERIVITDDGVGMDYEDARLAFERHATSKITREDDLFCIETMGFRGEALASIAAVAEVELATNNGQEATLIRWKYGQLDVYEHTSAPLGTRIEISGLFLKTPARFKYLRKPAYEFSVIADLVNKLALSYPEIRFTLIHNQRLAFQSTGSGDLSEVFYSIYGREVAMNAVEFANQSLNFSIDGLLIQPKISRASKYFIFISLNHRLIRSKVISDAVLEGYREFLPPGRFPIVSLNIECDPQLVDVNVHPNKWEVRLTGQDELGKLIFDTIRSAFAKNLETVQLKTKAQSQYENQTLDLQPERTESAEQTKEQPQPISEKPAFRPEPEKPDKPDALMEKMLHPDALPKQKPEQKAENKRLVEYPVPKNEPKTSPRAENSSAGSYDFPVTAQKSASKGLELRDEPEEDDLFGVNLNGSPNLKNYQPGNGETARQYEQEHNIERIQEEFGQKVTFKADGEPIGYPVPRPNPKTTGKELFDHLRVIGQLKKSYILCEGPEGLVIIDQHAAEERCNFERLQKALLQPVTQKQIKMVPWEFKVSPALVSRIEEVNEKTRSFGIEFEPFGEASVIVREVPLWFEGYDEKGFLEDILDLFQSGAPIDIPELRRHMTATAACHSSVRFHKSLSQAEMEACIQHLRECDQPYHCPHGRPTVITMSDADLRKEFERG